MLYFRKPVKQKNLTQGPKALKIALFLGMVLFFCREVVMEEAVHIGLLYEIYGFALTQTQQSLCEAYYYDELSLSEIAELRAISKVHSSVYCRRL